MTPISPSERKATLERLMAEWESKMNGIRSGESPIMAFLDLSVQDISNAAYNVDCPFCRRHMLLEAHAVKKVLERVELESNRVHQHGLQERLGAMVGSVQIVANVLLGALRRAGII